jgi:hypothetical protein
MTVLYIVNLLGYSIILTNKNFLLVKIVTKKNHITFPHKKIIGQ